MEHFLVNKRILVTGAGKGIGRGLTKTLVNGGAIVYAVDKTKDDLDSLKQECPTIIPIHLDISNYEETQNTLEKIEPLDGLVNNAGVALRNNILDATKAEFDEMINTNVRGTFHVSQILAKKMIEGGKQGSVVSLSSATSQRRGASLGIYATTKAAIDRLTKVFATELGKHQIRFNTVNPVLVMTELTAKLLSLPECSSLKDDVIKNAPLGRIAEIDDVVNAICFLLSDKASMITGTTLAIDGGLLSV